MEMHKNGFIIFFQVTKILLIKQIILNGLGDLDSIPGRIIPKIFKMALDTSLLNTQQYKIRIKSKVE